MEPFSVGIWISIILTGLLISLVWTLISKILHDENAYSFGKNYAENVFTYFVLICQKGSFHEPDNISSKTILGIMAYFATIIFAAYSANLISILMVEKVEVPFNSYHSLYYQTNYQVGGKIGSAYENIFKVSSLPKKRESKFPQFPHCA